MADKAYHHGDLHEALLDAGEQVLDERGVKGFTLRECARRAGVSHAAPKHHFGDNRGLLTEIAARGFDRLTRSLRWHLARAASLDEEFAATARAYVSFAERYPEHFRIMFRCDLVDDCHPRLRAAASGTFTELTNVILRQRGEAEIRQPLLDEAMKFEDLVEDILIGWTFIHGFAHLKLERQLDMVPSAAHDRLMGNVSARLAGLLRGEAPGSRAPTKK